MLSFDLDGTLFRKGTDDVFWNEKIPALLAEKKKISFKEAQSLVLEEYKKVGQGDVRWYIPEYWFNLFNLDTPLHTVLSTMNYASGVYDDIDAIREFAKNYMIIISTNNPRSILEHKLKALGCTDHILETFSSVSDFNNIVKNQHFYSQVCRKLGVRAEQVLHVGDDLFYDVSEPLAAGINAILMDRDGENNALHNLYDLLVILKNH